MTMYLQFFYVIANKINTQLLLFRLFNSFLNKKVAILLRFTNCLTCINFSQCVK